MMVNLEPMSPPIPLMRSAPCLGAALAVILLLLLPPIARAQSFVVASYTSMDDLPSDSIRGLAQGPDRRLWVATRAGLSVFDGTRFNTPRLTAGSQPDLESVVTDSNGTIWAVSRLIPFDIYHSTDGARWTTIPGPGEPSQSGVVTSLATLSSGKRTIVAVATSEGLFVWDGASWNTYANDQFSPGASLFDVAAFGGRLVVATSKGLFAVGEDGRVVPYDAAGPVTGKTVIALHEERPRTTAGADSAPERLWILTDRWLGYAQRDHVTTVLDRLTLPLIAGIPIARGSIAVDSLGGVYFGTASGLLYLDSPSSTVTPIGSENGLVGDGASTLLVDEEQNVWIGSARGLSKISSRRFMNFRQADGLLEDEVTAINEVSPGMMVFGHNGGLTFRRGSEFRRVDFGRGPASAAAATRVMEISRDSTGTVWIAAVEMGLGRIDRDGRLKWTSNESGLPSTVISVQPDGAGNLWVVGDGRLFVRRAGQTKFSEIAAANRLGSLRRVTVGSDGTVYAMGHAGLAIGSEQGWRYARSPSDREANDLYSVLPEGPDGRVWAGSGDGLWTVEGNRLVRLDLGGSRVDQPVYFILDDDRAGWIWLGTNDGVRVWNGKQLRSLSIRQGLAGRETNRSAAIVDHTGAVWIGTDGGASRYERRFDHDDRLPPTVKLLLVDAGGEKRPLSQKNEFASTRDSMTFRFSAVSMSDERILYRCYLEGIDSDWQPPVRIDSGRVRYTHLTPGIYRFHLMAGSASGPWSTPVVSAAIVIRKPFWRTAWFFGISAGALALLGLALQLLLRARRRSKYVDDLTRLPNRRALFQQLEKRFEEAMRTPGRSLAVLLLDLDHFRFVTTSLGPLAGDELLQTIARRLERCIDSPNILARLGSDEFAVLMPGRSGTDDALHLAERLQRQFIRSFQISGDEVFSSASIGIAIGPEGYRWATNLLRDADVAMHGAKARGLGGIEIFNRTMRARALGLLRLESDLRRAVERHEFRLLFQPIIRLEDLSLVSVEALLRWQHPVAGQIGPDDFLAVAEETGLIVEIGDWVLSEACRQLREWRNNGFRNSPLTIHANLSPRQLAQSSLPDRVRRVLEDNQLSPEDLVLEITEASVIEKSEVTSGVIDALREMGAPLCIDDFGAGHSSLSYIRDLPIKYLKLDRSFVSRGMVGRGMEIVETILSLGRSLGLPVIAEGVESYEEYTRLAGADCFAAQGFLFSKPVSADLIHPELDLSRIQGSSAPGNRAGG